LQALTVKLTLFIFNGVRDLRDTLQIVMAPKKSKPKRKQSWPYVYSRKHRSGQVGCVVDLGLINGKRERP